MSNKDFEDLSLIDGFLVLSVASDLKCGRIGLLLFQHQFA